MSPAPRSGGRRKTNADHFYDMVRATEEIEKAIARVDDARLNDEAREQLKRMRQVVIDAKHACGTAIGALAGGGSAFTARPIPATVFSDKGKE